jgi:RNA polymerase sigma-70 factor (ECF subfamily)
MSRWRIADQFRKRKKDNAIVDCHGMDDSIRTAVIDRFEDQNGPEIERIWEAEWNKSITDRSLAKVKGKVSPKQFQIFDCYVVQGWSVDKVKKELGVSIAQVYLAKHRIGSILKKEIQKLEKQLF